MGSLKTTMILLAVIVSSSGCRTFQQAGDLQKDDADWKRFVDTAQMLDLRSESGLSNYYAACETLGLTNLNYFIHGPVVAAKGTIRHVFQNPPKIWEASDDQVLIVQGKVIGTNRSEYILGAGWSGPMGGVLAVYDTHLHKLAEIEMEDIWSIETKDVTADGSDEIICWEDEHHGNGLWTRWMTILKYVDGKGLVAVWRGATYDEAGESLNKYDISIEQKKGQPSRIRSKHTYEQYLEPGDRNGNRELIKSHPNEVSSYVWNPATLRFEEE
jgi:hypothetical protein